jgi:putative membrane protein
MTYENVYQFAGMHVVWWIIWLILMFWIFAVPYDIPGQRKKKDSALDILKRRFALGEIGKEEFVESKTLLQD